MLTMFMTVMRLSRLRILVAVVIIFGLAVRIAPILEHQVFFWFDQGLDLVLVKQLVVDHHLSLTSRYSGLAGVLMGPLWTWVLSIPFILGRGDPAANTVFFPVISLAAAILGYRLFKDSMSGESRLFYLILFVFSPVVIAASQIASSPNPLSFLFIFYIWFLYQIAIEGRSFFLWPLLLLTGIFFQLEIGFALFALPTTFVVLLVFKKWRFLWSRYFWLGIFLLGLTFIPQILFDIRHNFLISRGVIEFLTGGNNSLYSLHNSLPIRFVERGKSFWEDFSRMVLFIKPWYLAGLMLLLTVVGWVLKRRELVWLKLLAVTLGSFYVGFSLYPGPFWEWYREGLPIIYILLIAIGLGEVWQRFKLARLVVIILLAVYIFQGSQGGVGGNDNANLKNQMAVLDYIYITAKDQRFSYFAYTPPVYDYVWAYDFWWYGQRKYGYLPSNWQMTVPLLGIGKQLTPPGPNEGLFFVILEPNRERPWEPSGWLSTYIKYGKVLDRREFPGGIIAEERRTN